ncbi:MAG: radical SAM protein [Firmicutes bacterium]|nr:radical SAM protein [Bacillota bacterium]
MRIAGIVKESIVDGEGLRFVIFVQGCPHRCEGCHNKDTWCLDGGQIADVDSIVGQIKRLDTDVYSGITFSGGEPFLYAKELSTIAKEARALGLDVVTYTGYTYEQILADIQTEIGGAEKEIAEAIAETATESATEIATKRPTKRPKEANNNSHKLDLLKNTDTLIDGRFDNNLKDLSLAFKGSANQRTIDVKKSLSAGKVVEY